MNSLITARVRPICLPYSSRLLESWPNLILTAVGWGSMDKIQTGQQQNENVKSSHVITFNGYVSNRICVQFFFYKGQKAITPYVLKQVDLDLQTRSLCNKFHTRMYGKTTKSRICVGGNTGRATCNGDSVISVNFS